MLIKKIAPIVIIFFALPILGFSQPRHVKGMDMMGVFYSSGVKTNSIGGSYQKYISSNISLKGSGSFQKVSFEHSSYQSALIAPELYYTIASDKTFYFFNIKAGILSGVEWMKNEVINSSRQGVYVGESIGTSLEIFIIPSFKLEVEWQQNFFQKSYIANYRYCFKIGGYIII